MCFFFFKQKTAYEMRISDWSSDVCSSDLIARLAAASPQDDGDEEDEPALAQIEEFVRVATLLLHGDCALGPPHRKTLNSPARGRLDPATTHNAGQQHTGTPAPASAPHQPPDDHARPRRHPTPPHPAPPR